MEDRRLQEIELTRIARCPWQARREFDGRDFDDLVVSVREKGVLQPVLVRPLEKLVKVKDKDFPNHGREADFELMAGERRYRALWKVAIENGGPEKTRIPAIVCMCTDDEAFEISMIENLQRKDLNEIEEAQGFKAYLDRKGVEAVAELSEKTGIHQRYIRRRVGVLSLPEPCLKAWEKGKVLYGHLEQLMRLSDKQEILFFLKEVQRTDWMTVSRLREEIDRKAPSLSWAKFDTADCSRCQACSDVQKKLFGGDGVKGKCLDPKCFKQKQNNHFTAWWPKHGKKAYGTNGFRFWSYGELAYHPFHEWEWHKMLPSACKECKDFATLIDIQGTANIKMACLGESSCFKRNEKPPKRGQKKEEPEHRCHWHGDFFRQNFYMEEIPNHIPARADDERLKRVTLYSLTRDNVQVEDWLISLSGKEDDKGGRKRYSYIADEAWAIIEKLPAGELDSHLRDANLVIMKSAGYGVRGPVARYLGIDLSKEWKPTKEYFDKKTMGELHAYAEEFKIFETKQAETYLYEALGKKRKAFKSCKKHELVSLLLNCGLDLKGCVPKEVLDAEKAEQIKE